MGNCSGTDRKQKPHIGPIKPELHKIKIRFVEAMDGPTKGSVKIDDANIEDSGLVYEIISQESRTTHYKLINKEIAAFYDENNDNELVIVGDRSKLHHNKVYAILVSKIKERKFKFLKAKANCGVGSQMLLTSGGVITEETETEETDDDDKNDS